LIVHTMYFYIIVSNAWGNGYDVRIEYGRFPPSHTIKLVFAAFLLAHSIME